MITLGIGMDNDIEIVPALKRVELKNVGCWAELCTKFLPGLNIITGDSGTGKSTILRAIVKAVHPSSRTVPLSVTNGCGEGCISVEFMRPAVSVSLEKISPKPKTDESHGQSMLRLLSSCLKSAQPGTALLVENDVTAALDISLFREAVKLLNSACCQVICIIGHRLDPNDFKKARIYSCFWDRAEKKTGIRLQQSPQKKGRKRE